MAQHPANYAYIHDWLTRRFGETLPQQAILDFGCGDGGLVEYLRAHGLNVVGADPYGARYGGWQQDKPYLRKIENGILPFDNAAFDIVISNQVFEHIDDHEQPLAEIHRVLKTGGTFLALFPTFETVYEVHSGIPFAYYLKPFPVVLRAYLYLWRALGFGLWKADMTPRDWARQKADIIIDECHYKTHGAIKRLWRTRFAREPQTHQADYLRFRLPKTKALPDIVAGWITSLRAGIVISITK